MQVIEAVEWGVLKRLSCMRFCLITVIGREASTLILRSDLALQDQIFKISKNKQKIWNSLALLQGSFGPAGPNDPCSGQKHS